MMRRIATGVLLLLLVAGLGWSFDLSVVAGGGFGLGMDKEVFGTEIQGSPGDYVQYSNYFVGMSTGPRGVGGVELGFGDNFSLGLSGAYVRSLRLHLEQSDAPGGHDVYLRTTLVPVHLTFRGLIPLGRIGFFFGGGPSMSAPGEGTVTDTAGDEEWVIDTRYSPGWGYHAVAGTEVHLGSRISLRLEIRGEQLTARPTRATIVSYTSGGVDLLDTAYPDTNDREVIFVDDIAEYLNDPVDPTDPAQELAYNLSFDNITAYLGVVVHLIR